MNTQLVAVFFISAIQALVSAGISVILALILIHIVYSFNFYGKHLLLSIAPLCAVMPTKLCALSVELFYGVQGLVAIILSHILMNLPFAFFLLDAAYQKIDQTLMWSAADLGASEWQKYTTCMLPVIKPTIKATMAIIFLLCFSSFSIPLIFALKDYHFTLDVKLYQLYQNSDYQQFGWCLLVRLLLVIPVCLWTYSPLQNSMRDSFKPCQFDRVNRPRSLKVKMFIFFALVAVIVLILGPFSALAKRLIAPPSLVKLFWYVNGAHIDIVGVTLYRLIFDSFCIAGLSSIGSVFFALILAISMYLVKNSFLKKCISMIALLPFLCGTVGIGILCDQLSLLGVYSPWVTVIISHVLLNYPFAFRSIQTQLCTYNYELSYTAASLGADSWKIGRTILLPYVRSTLLYAWCLVFSLSLVEVGAVSVINHGGIFTLPLAIRLLRKTKQHQEVFALCFVLLVVVFVANWCAFKVRKTSFKI